MSVDDGELLGREFIAAVVVFHELVGRRLGLSAIERKTLDVLTRLGPSSNRDIAEHTGLTTGAVTGLIDRLEKRGHVLRTADPHDRRRIVVELIDHPERAAVTAQVFGPLRTDMAAVVADFSPEQQAAIADFQRRTTDVLKQHIQTLSTEGKD